MTKTDAVPRLCDFEHLRNRRDRHVNSLRDDCRQTAADLRRTMARRAWWITSAPRWSAVFWTIMAAATPIAVCLLNHAHSWASNILGTVVIWGLFYCAHGVSREYASNRKMTITRRDLWSCADKAANVISQALPRNRPKAGTTLAADAALAEAYDDLLVEMRRAVVILGQNYLWQDPAVADVERSLRRGRRL